MQIIVYLLCLVAHYFIFNGEYVVFHHSYISRFNSVTVYITYLLPVESSALICWGSLNLDLLYASFELKLETKYYYLRVLYCV